MVGLVPPGCSDEAFSGGLVPGTRRMLVLSAPICGLVEGDKC